MSLQTIIEDPGLTYAMGRSGFEAFRKFGSCDSISSSFNDIWTNGGTYAGWFTSSGVVSVVSSDAADTAAGTGLRKVLVVGLDNDFMEQQEEVTLSGTTPVATTLSFRRCWRLVGSEVGTYGGTNAGTITASIGGAACSIIPAGFGQSREALYTVPANKQLFVSDIRVSSGAGKASEIRYMIRLNANVTSGAGMQPWRAIGRANGVSGPSNIPLTPWTLLPPYTDIRIQAKTSAGSGDVAAAFEGVLYRVIQ